VERGIVGGKFSKLGLGIISCLAVSLLALNIFFWYRYVAATQLWGRLEDGSCELKNPKAYSPGWKFGWSFPVTGPSWTDVPCSVQLHASSHDSEMTGEATLHFTYWQGLVWEYLKDSCGKLLPQLHEPFGCCLDGRGTAFVGKVESLPHLPTLLLMKASGLSLLTLGPVLLMCINMGRKASACEIPVEGEVEERYAVLREDVDGI